ncbi:hypothetical protein J6590_073569 [Homalodisca vitripennis]|nr:hypothetical protein J6590_073569 [Homalodisca vitripennis]
MTKLSVGYTSAVMECPVAFSCVGVECPSEFEPPPEPGCYNVHEHGQCCSVKEICDSNSKEGEAEGKTPKEMCEYNNKVYQVGEQFYPEESSCLECICGPGFVGLLQEPFCRKINCSLELNYAERIMDGCVPVYFGNNDCCPHGWRCRQPALVPNGSLEMDYLSLGQPALVPNGSLKMDLLSLKHPTLVPNGSLKMDFALFRTSCTSA